MAMIWDALLVSALAAELRPLLDGARLRGHRFRWEERRLELFFREGALRWHLHPEEGWLTFSPGEPLPEPARPLSAVVTDVRAPPDERRLEIHLRRPRGKRRGFRLVVELMTNQWNAFLLDGEEGWIRHLLWTRNLPGRPLVVGHPYVPPPPSTRKGRDGPFPREDWRAFLEGKSAEEARRILLEDVAFTSPINTGFLLPGSGEAEDRSLGEAVVERARERWEWLQSRENAQACVLEMTGDKQPYPVVIEDFNYTHFPDLLTAIEAVSRANPRAFDPAESCRDRLERALHRARGRVRGVRKEMEQAADPREPRDRANLLLARLDRIPRGAASVVLQGFLGEEVRVPLDPTLSPRENVEALYEEASRRERAGARLPTILEAAEREVAELEAVARGLADGSLSVEEASRLIPGGERSGKPGEGPRARVPYRSYRSSGGLEIRVGRNARDNDALTFRHSHPEDIWLHARDGAGAHVVLRWRQEGSPPQRDLAEAAALAALHSGSRAAGLVPVDWTRRKYVRKPRRAPPGTVVLQRSRTLFVEPDPELERALRDDAQAP